MSGKLYIIPTVLAEDTETEVLSRSITTTIAALDHFLCENVRTARRYLSRLRVHASVEALHFELLDKDTLADQLPALLQPLKEGHSMGLLSESGCPGIADPGAAAVAYAHDQGIPVIPLVGPSSVILALMASGLNGQQFAFHGYLPVDSRSSFTRIKVLEKESREKNQTQIFIETPYRNNKLLVALLDALAPNTRLCVAIDLTAPSQRIICQTVAKWKKAKFQIEKVPVTFLFLGDQKAR